jgi:hypothetical protein
MLGMKKIIVVIAILCMSGIAYAEQEFVGAFGVRLGDTVDENMKYVEENKLGELIYKFTPAKPNEYFLSYWVHATHKSKKIFTIIAESDYVEKTICYAKEQIISASLKDKYGPYSFIKNMWSDSTGRSISLLCIGSGYPPKLKLQASYFDSVLSEVSIIEKAESIKDSL